MSLTFTWDKRKNKLNYEKHGLDFADVELVFQNPVVTFEDDRFDYGETRFVTLGLLAQREVVIVHTPRGSAVRVISMRKVNEREKNIYKKRLGTL